MMELRIMNVKIRVSDEMDFLAERRALVQTLDWRKTSRGAADSEGTSSIPSERMAREASSREPMW